MNFRPAFWPGFLLGTLTAFAAFFRKPPPALPIAPDRLLDFVSEAVVTGDASGQITQANAAAYALFGPDLAGYQGLCYPTGQPVSPGQLPLTRRDFSPTRFLLTDADGQTHTLEATNWLQPTGAAAVFRDVTAQAHAEAKDTQAQADTDALNGLCRRLDTTRTAEDAAEAAVEAALTLGADTARCFTYDAERKQLIQAAARPDTRPKRPRTQTAARPETASFDAADPLHWAVYVSKEPYQSAETLAVPLTAGGTVLGHLEVSAGPELSREALTLAAFLTAATLAARQEVDRADAGAAREAAVLEIASLLAQATPLDTLCDAAAAHLRRLLPAEVCTVTVSGRLRGQDYHDALLRPERHTPDNPALRHEAADAAMASGAAVQRSALKSPEFADAVWRAFAGASGQHRVLAVPLTGKNAVGVLTVCAAGDGVFTPAQVQLAETVAALLSVRSATAKAGRTKPQTSPGPAGAD